MTVHDLNQRKANTRGGAWMVAAMGAFAVEDAFVKVASATLPIGQILMMFGIGGAALFVVIAMRAKEPLFTSDVMSRPMRYRVLFEVVGRLFYTLAIVLTPLSTTTVILQATPIVVVAVASRLFDERVGWRRWMAICIGSIGVLMIVQPSADGFSPLSALALIGMLGFAGRDLASRVAPRNLSTAILGLYGFLAVVLAGVLVAIWDASPFVWPDRSAWLAVLTATLFGVGAYSALMKAMRLGEVSAVTPFRYSRLIFGIGFGVVLFDEMLDATMVMGSLLIVISGLFILWRGGRVN